MRKETLKALQGSIAKWQRIVDRATALEYGKDNCPLCTIFFHKECEHCPVYESTGEGGCSGTPYEPWRSHVVMHYERHHRTPGCKECLRLAKAELAFLVGLLPDKDKKHGIGEQRT